jgi:hypothetical protein
MFPRLIKHRAGMRLISYTPRPLCPLGIISVYVRIRGYEGLRDDMTEGEECVELCLHFRKRLLGLVPE